MPIQNGLPPDLLDLSIALVVAILSGFISIAQRIVRGQKASLLWITSEYTAAILSGWLAYDAYPMLVDTGYVPEQMTPFIVVAVAAHFAGRTFQGVENFLTKRLGRPPST